MPPPPGLEVTSPERGLMQESGRVVVKGTTQPNADGDPVARVTVNKVPAMLAPDGSFTAIVDVPAGATLLETVATTQDGGSATDARAVQSGKRHQVGTPIERAVTAALSADAFAKLSSAAGPLIRNVNLASQLAPVTLGDGIANVRLSLTRLAFGDVTISMTPIAGGLAFSTQLDQLDVAASAAYGGTLVPDGTTTIGITAERITITGTLLVTPAGTSGFTTTISSPVVQTIGLRLNASGLVGQILQVVNNNLASTVQKLTTRAAERGLEPLMNTALGALAGPQRIDVLGKTLDLQVSPSAIVFTPAGALVTMSLQAKLAGTESSPGYILTPNGTPAMDGSSDLQLGLADDLINELLAQLHALGLFDIHLPKDFGVFDTIDLELALPPMVSANNDDGTLRIVLGDMIATISNDGSPLARAAINARVDLEILRGANPQQVAIEFGHLELWVNVLRDANTESGGFDISSAAAAGIGIQLDSVSRFLVNVPVPAVAGVTLENLSMHADSGYLVIAGDVD
ncbi:MAG: hypothetical protein H0T89_24685 [Deltaproteobacteria bacterium]|nr:hypothetical protein [Deltaproteobacteria bacterium]